jgi:GT2 family glycosyltransferase
MNQQIGVVIIGRNEGERLSCCLKSVLKETEKVVYVDSDSDDNSVSYARSLGIYVLQLDIRTPFSAARARNEGFWYMISKYPQLKFIQFIDGDCELCEGWLSSACEHLENNPSCAIVAGRVRERFPEKSIYNLLCNIEWDTPLGEVKYCGGIFMTRKNVFQEEGGFNPTVIAGEEPELCYRLREKGWKIYRLDYLMALHDAAMTMFSQWWKRAIRSGHAYAQGYFLHLNDGGGYYFKDSFSIWLWACILPCFILLLTFLIESKFLLLSVVFPIQMLRITLDFRRCNSSLKHALIYSFFIIIGKWPQLIGQLLFIKRRFIDKKFSIIEHS